MRWVWSLVLLLPALAGCFDNVPGDDALLDPGEPQTYVGWRVVTQGGVPRTEIAVGQIGPHIYAVAGMANDTDGGIVAERFDAETGVWERLPDMPFATHHTSATGLDGKLYVMGGFDANGPSGLTMTDRCFVFDPATNAWSEIAPMPGPRAAHAAAAVDGKVYVIGGYTVALAGHTPHVAIYDPELDLWTAGAPIPTPRDHLGVAAIGTKIYAVGGDLLTHANSADALEAYDTATGLWEVLDPLPTPRGSMSAVNYEDTLLVLGGQDGTRTYDDVDRYDPATGTWDKLDPMLSTRHGFGAAVWDGYAYAVMGGPEPGATYTADVEAYGLHVVNE